MVSTKDRKIMQKTFKHISARGFTLIELLVVIAIIGLLSTVIAAPITQARKKGRDGKKVADLHQITGALQQFADDHAGDFPSSLDGLVPIYLAVLPPFAATTSAPAKDKYIYSTYTTSDFRKVGFHMGVKLEAPNLSLGDDRDCHGEGTIIPANAFCIDDSADAGNVITLAASNFTAALATDPSFPNDNNSAGLAGSAFQPGDFQGGADTATSSCTALFKATAGTMVACIYDITN